MDFSTVNVYEMFVQNGREVGFWLTRTTWNAKIARVKLVGELKGLPPYYGNPKVMADLYDATSGQLLQSGLEITAAGTYKTWRLQETPKWWRKEE